MWLKWGIDTVKTYRRNDPEILRTLIAQNEAFIHSRELKFANLSGIELFDFILKDFEERKNTLFKGYGAVFFGEPTPHHGSIRTLQKWLGEKNVADVLAQSISNNVTSEMGT